MEDPARPRQTIRQLCAPALSPVQRPALLFPLFAEVSSLKGVGPASARLIARAAGESILDLLLHLPSGVIDRRRLVPIAAAPLDLLVTVRGRVTGHRQGQGGKVPSRVTIEDASGVLEAAFFHARGDWLNRRLPYGQEVLLSGRIELFRERRQMTQPEAYGPAAEAEEILTIEPVYPLTAGLANKALLKAMAQALAAIPDLPEWQDAALMRRERFPAFADALRQAHAPETEADLEPLAPARRRLAYDELLANQLALSLLRQRLKRRSGQRRRGDGSLTAALLQALPYRPTEAQAAAIAEIRADMAAPGRMLRLLQGDVGSGKTLVALLAIAAAIEAGAQAVLMAPTELLARQHAESLIPLLLKQGRRAAVLTGRDKGRARDGVLLGLAEGSIDLVIGTHALFQEDVSFRRLGLVVIDEQHRFGVHQRLALSDKGADADVLVMTATPIPRTLALTSYGDMDVSRMLGKPPGRQPVATAALPADRLPDLIARLQKQIAAGAQAYWVCPLVEEADTLPLVSAEARFAQLREVFGESVGLVHGRLKAEEKDRVMAEFISGRLSLLVATTVIEVGVNVPRATVMVIEHAERFGLAQLHQLRGRVGRGSGASSCVLLYHGELNEVARARLQTLRETEDGFRIAEEDLRLRGAGEVLGTKQSGLPDFRVADVAAHGDLLAVAQDDARLILDQDPQLQSPRGEALRLLLHLFRRGEAAAYLKAG